MTDKIAALSVGFAAASARATTRVATAPHRTDIDGLRACAVLPVVAYHAGLHVVRGGFIGVDVFFVISGFLITQLLVKDIVAERFSIARFYERRIRRILPALLAVLLTTFLLGLHYCLPSELVDLSKSLISAALSASNVYFWEVSGYFAGPAAGKPLLHTWSLAVEEQFYIFWPLFLLAGHRFFGRHLLLVTLFVTTVSLAASIVGVFRYPDATFYLPFTRIWELSVGGLLALGVYPKTVGPIARNLLSGVGLALILGSVFLIDSDMPFPGLLAIPPCLGAVLVILAGRDGRSLAGLGLSLPPIAFVGVISYSLYLWHWPIVVFQNNYTFLASGLTESANKILIIAVSVFVAYLSWKFIEQPVRTGQRRPSARILVAGAAAGTVIMLLLGVVGWSGNGFPDRYSAHELEVAEYLNYADNSGAAWRSGRCFLSGDKYKWQFGAECLAISDSKKNYLLLGDSHAAQLWSGLSATFPDVNFLEATAADCFPTVVHSVTEASKCTKVMDDVLKRILLERHIDRVFLAARWKAGLLDNVSMTLQWLQEHHLPATLVGPTALYDSPVPRLIVTSMREGDASLPQRHLNESTWTLDGEMAKLARSRGVPYISMMELQCLHHACSVAESSGIPLIWDREHFTVAGSRIVAQKMRDAKLIS